MTDFILETTEFDTFMKMSTLQKAILARLASLVPLAVPAFTLKKHVAPFMMVSTIKKRDEKFKKAVEPLIADEFIRYNSNGDSYYMDNRRIVLT
jgi:hypothetical protein